MHTFRLRDSGRIHLSSSPLLRKVEKRKPKAFNPSEGRVIGRLDEAGTLVLVVDPATLQPEILRMFPGYDKEGTPPQTDLVSASE
jgi:hypothetical protein